MVAEVDEVHVDEAELEAKELAMETFTLKLLMCFIIIIIKFCVN